jgi:amino acid transporter
MVAKKKKEFRLFDAVLAAVCIVLVVESVAPVAAIGPMQYIWWAIMLIAFFLPYGMISAELGTTYDDEGGLYDWVKRAFGRRTGSRTAWYYWVNFPLWMASLAVMFTSIFTEATGIELNWGISLVIQLAFIWFVIFVSNFRVSQSKGLINAGTIVKVILVLMLGCLGIYGAVTNGMANSGSLADISPLMGISFVSIILFNFMGFEVVTTFAGDMKNPKKEIPKAIILGGILIAVFYLFAAFGISAAIPVNELSVETALWNRGAVDGQPTGHRDDNSGHNVQFTLIATFLRGRSA